jgi:pimeloyl-ACP methyl ester carboxylesterase
MKNTLSISIKSFLSGIFILFISCQQSQQQNQMGTKPLYREDFIQARGIKLHYLDWGGSGQTLILIHGLGDSPYIFQDLAASLRKNFRVIAYSRRGHCKSEATDMLYDNSTLVLDLKLLLDSLNIIKANLLGWSMGGNEITEFAIRYPERTNKLIYFESGYDLSDEAFNNILKTIPKSPLPDSSDLKTLDAYRKWYHNFWFADVDWNPSLEANLKASTQINPDSSVSTIPNNYIFKILLETAKSYHRDYKMVQAPALAIYTKPFFVPPVKKENIVSAYGEMEKNIINPWRLSNMNRISTELKNVTIKEMALGSHTSFIFLSRDSLIESINSFLLN